MLKYDHGAWRDAVGVELRGDYLAHLLGGRGHLRLRNEYIYIYIYTYTYIYIYIYCIKIMMEDTCVGISYWILALIKI